VVTPKGFLQHREPAWSWRKPFDGAQPSPIHLNRERQTGTGRNIVDLDGTRATHTMLAADVGASHTQRLTEEITQQHPRLHLRLHHFAIELEANRVRGSSL
jgi:hypothetical protein